MRPVSVFLRSAGWLGLALVLLAPARGEVIRVRAEVKRAGRTLTVCSADAYADGTLCATMLGTMICLAKPKEK